MLTSRQQAANARKVARERFRGSRLIERDYQRSLVAVGRQVGSIIAGFAPGGAVRDFPALEKALNSYSLLLAPWAESVTKRMHDQSANRGLTAWRQLSRQLGAGLEKELTTAPVGDMLRDLMQDQVKLIRSIPREAAERVHELTMKNLLTGERSDSVAADIMRSGKVAASRARLIATTETSRTASLLTQARSQWVGSDSYTWRGMDDGAERPQHLKLNNTVHRWDTPPIAGPNGMRYHAGCGPNCRCFASPILPD